MSKYEIKFEKCGEAWKVVEKMKAIIKEYGQVRVADQKELCGEKSTYTDNIYGWKDLRNHFITYDAAFKKYILHLNQPEPLEKGCTDDICTEDTIAAYCKFDCLSTQNIMLTKDKMELESELEKVKKELEEAKSKVASWYAYAIGRNNLCCLLQEQRKEQIKELEEARLLNDVLKKEIDNLKWEKEWYEAHYTEAKKNINELQEKLDNTTRSYSCVADNLYKKKNQFKEAMRLLKNAEFYMNSGQDIHSMYPQWVKGYYSTVNNIKEFINKKED